MKITAYESLGLGIIVLAILGVIGWVMNIFEIAGMTSDPLTGMFILRCIGVFVAPLGGILGWL